MKRLSCSQYGCKRAFFVLGSDDAEFGLGIYFAVRVMVLWAPLFCVKQYKEFLIVKEQPLKRRYDE